MINSYRVQQFYAMHCISLIVAVAVEAAAAATAPAEAHNSTAVMYQDNIHHSSCFCLETLQCLRSPACLAPSLTSAATTTAKAISQMLHSTPAAAQSNRLSAAQTTSSCHKLSSQT
jgi:hypothetical protein